MSQYCSARRLPAAFEGWDRFLDHGVPRRISSNHARWLVEPVWEPRSVSGRTNLLENDPYDSWDFSLSCPFGELAEASLKISAFDLLDGSHAVPGTLSWSVPEGVIVWAYEVARWMPAFENPAFNYQVDVEQTVSRTLADTQVTEVPELRKLGCDT